MLARLMIQKILLILSITVSPIRVLLAEEVVTISSFKYGCNKEIYPKVLLLTRDAYTFRRSPADLVSEMKKLNKEIKDKCGGPAGLGVGRSDQFQDFLEEEIRLSLLSRKKKLKEKIEDVSEFRDPAKEEKELEELNKVFKKEFLMPLILSKTFGPIGS